MEVGGRPDLRDAAAAEPAQTGEDELRVASPAETDASLAGATRALTEILMREIDEQAEAEYALPSCPLAHRRQTHRGRRP